MSRTRKWVLDMTKPMEIHLSSDDWGFSFDMRPGILYLYTDGIFLRVLKDGYLRNFHTSIKRRSMQSIRHLFSSFKIKCRPKTPALHHSSCQGLESDLREMEKKIIKWGPSILEISLENEPHDALIRGLKPLEDAVQCGHVECVRFLLKQGACIKAGLGQNSVLFYASFDLRYQRLAMNKQIFKILLEAGADVNKNGFTHEMRCGPIFMQLAMYGNQFLDIIIECFKHGANHNGICRLRRAGVIYIHQYLNTLVLFSTIEVLEVFLKYGADQDTRYFLPMFHTNFSRFRHIYYFIFNHGAKLLKQAKLLLMYNANVDSREKLFINGRRNTEYLSLAQFVLKIGTQDEALLTIFNLMHQFGYNFSSENQSICQKYPDQIRVINKFCQPLKLKELCRLSIKKSIGSHYKTKSGELKNLPETLYPFLLFEDVEV